MVFVMKTKISTVKELNDFYNYTDPKIEDIPLHSCFSYLVRMIIQTKMNKTKVIFG